jgi:hypothetical protein
LDEAYRLLMRAGGTIYEVEAALDLLYRTPDLFAAMRQGGFVRPEDEPSGRPFLNVYFGEALAAQQAGSLQLSGSELSVLRIAASLAGKLAINLRYDITGLDRDSARHVAEAMMRAAGCLDASADPTGGFPDNFEGPRAEAYDLRIVNED